MRRKSEAGQALWVTAAALTALMGFAGLAIDMGVLRYEKRLQQTAADAAALAGASNLLPTPSGVTTGAQDASGTNGFADTGGGQVSACGSGAAVGTVCVQVNNPPQSGPHQTDGKYVEVLVAAVHPTYFMKVLGIKRETITARAVATNLGGGTGGGCLYTLGPPTSSIEGVNINGSATLNAPTCGILDNGDYNTQGNALTVSAASFGVSGDANVSGKGGSVTCGTSGPCPAYGIPAAADPMTGLTPPCTSCSGGSSINVNGRNSSCGAGCSFGNGIYTISPGTYSSITISGTGTGHSVFFQPGVYIIDGSGGFSETGNAALQGSAVTFYFANNATVSIRGTPTVTLTAPGPDGTYPGILMWQAASDTNVGPLPNGPTLGGNSGSNYNGLLYFPSDQLTFFGTNNSLDVGIVVAQSLALSGNPTVNLQGNADMPSGVGLVKDAILVE